MCYRNCPYENQNGECTVGRNIPPDAFCRLDDLEEFEDMESDENMDFEDTFPMLPTEFDD